MQRTLQVFVRAAMLGGIILCFFVAAGALAEHAPLWVGAVMFVTVAALFVHEVQR